MSRRQFARATRIARLTTEKFKSKWEAEYAIVLDARKAAGQILWWTYESIKFRLADGAIYTPDFAVVLADGTLEIHEVKGYWREAAKVRWKVVRELFPFVFKLVKKKSSTWEIIEE